MWLITVILMSQKIFYEKVGRRYKPVSVYDNDYLDSYPKGTHLVVVYPGGTLRRFNIDPQYAPLIAAGTVAEDAISKAIMDATSLRLPRHQKKLTEGQRSAWKKLSEEMGVNSYALEWPSAREAAEAAVESLRAEAEKLLTNPSIKAAYDHFMLVCALSKEGGNSNG